MFANGSRRVQRGVAKCKAPRGEASRLVPVLVPRRCDDHFIPFIPSSIITRSNVAQAPTYITVVEGLGLSPYNLLVGAQILKQVYTTCFGLQKSFCTVIEYCTGMYRYQILSIRRNKTLTSSLCMIYNDPLGGGARVLTHYQWYFTVFLYFTKLLLILAVNPYNVKQRVFWPDQILKLLKFPNIL